ncbi:MAG: MaoC family dehydratase N-terminal domain-containing protein [Actinomycetota bacterium]|nr:MaoC family dehydratase N-terminal domain-containing protein [Actinomycetota bacterium]
MNQAAEGTRYPDVRFQVDPAQVAAFRNVFGISSGIPVTFLTLAEFAVFPEVIGDPNLALDFSRVVHGGQEYEYRRPLVEGETLIVRTHIESIREKGGTGFLTLATELVDVDGHIAATARSTMIERAG